MLNLLLLRAGAGRKVGVKQRIVWIVCCIGFLAICLGCMSIGGKTEVVNREDRSSTQSGKTTIGSTEIQEIYYPVPYAQPPNLELECTLNDCVIVEQKADHCKIKNMSVFPRTVSWTARGVIVSTLPVQVAPTPVQTVQTSAETAKQAKN